MADVSNEKHLSFKIDKTADHEKIVKVARAFASEERLAILKFMLNKSVSVSMIANELDMPISSVSRHIDVLSDAGLIVISYQPGLKGHTKFCAQAVLDAKISLDAKGLENKSKSFIVEMPIGMYSDCNIDAPCGIAGKDDALGTFDDVKLFYTPTRALAECLWFKSGFISYLFPSPPLAEKTERHRISFSLEICSDTIYYNNDWLSDITVKINGAEVITFTSPGNFGGKRGKYTPQYWPVNCSQFGQLKKISIDADGVYLDNVFQHKKLTFADLHLFDDEYIKFEIGVDRNAVHCGGMSLFGKNFGDFDQAIIMKIS